jgi:hypothetical protein
LITNPGRKSDVDGIIPKNILITAQSLVLFRKDGQKYSHVESEMQRKPFPRSSVTMRSLVVLCGLLAACVQHQDPARTIAPEQFEAVYLELLDSAAIAPPSESDSTVSPTAERILRRHQVTIEQFKATVASYHTDTKKWKEFYANILKKYDERSTMPAE